MATEDPAPTATRRRRRVTLIAVAAIVLVLAAGALTWAVLDDPDEARIDAEQACELVDRLPDELSADGGSEDSRAQLRLGAALSLALAAQEGDDDYEDLADAATRARAELGNNFELSEKTLDGLRSECDEID